MVDVLVVKTWKFIAAPLVTVHLVIINKLIKAIDFFNRTWHSRFGSTW